MNSNCLTRLKRREGETERGGGEREGGLFHQEKGHGGSTLYCGIRERDRRSIKYWSTENGKNTLYSGERERWKKGGKETSSGHPFAEKAEFNNVWVKWEEDSRFLKEKKCEGGCSPLGGH